MTAYLSNIMALPLGIHMAANLLQQILGFKPDMTPMWFINISNENQGVIAVETLGVSMQIMLLVVSLLVLEVALRRKEN